MGETEKCPKCSNKLLFEPAGYIRATPIEGVVAPTAGHYRCWCCGFYKDIEETPTVPLPAQRSPLTREQQKQSGRRKPENVGINAFVTEQYDVIVACRAKKWNWEKITKYIVDSRNNYCAEDVAHSFHRIQHSRRQATAFKAVRADKQPYGYKKKGQSDDARG